MAYPEDAVANPCSSLAIEKGCHEAEPTFMTFFRRQITTRGQKA